MACAATAVANAMRTQPAAPERDGADGAHWQQDDMETG
jgi:hypothetical protein